MGYPKSACSKGGQVTAIRSRKEAIRRYYENPNVCLFCDKVIEVKEGQKVAEVRKKKYCNQSCSAKASNKRRALKLQFSTCSICGKRFKRERLTSGAMTKRKKCRQCELVGNLGRKTKAELLSESKDFASYRCTITKCARRIFDATEKEQMCAVCGYSTHIEVCHKVPVSDFADDSTIWEINHPDNLVALCPNHHWEFDHGILNLAE